MNTDEKFFYDHAAWTWWQAGETEEAGRRRGAKEHADAERIARERMWEVRWYDDWSVDHATEYDCYADGEPSTCEYAVLRNAEGEVLGSLHCIDDATPAYRRIIAAELADEALWEEDHTVAI